MDLERQLELAQSEIRQLKREQDQASAVLEALPDLLFVLDAAGTHLDFYAPSQDRLFVKPEEFMGRTVSEVLPPDVAEIYRENIRSTLESRSPRRFEYSIDWGHGEGARDYEGRMVVSGPESVLVIVRNVTELNRVRRNLLRAQKLESLAMLTSGIAHDFNNLLMVITGHLELALLDLEATSGPHDRVTDAMKTARRAGELIGQLLIYAGNKDTTAHTFDLSALVQDMGSLVRTSIFRGITLSYDLGEALPLVLGDPNGIRQIVLNLITNASQAIGDTSGEITLSTAQVECDEAFLSALSPDGDLTPGTYLRLRVSDTGPGLDEVTRGRIFDPFFTTKPTGSGLGLATVLAIVTNHAGGITVESKPGEGSTFTIFLPRA